ncbi:MAG: DUF5659 domain-containing protein [Thermotaleaceae bacterium]
MKNQGLKKMTDKDLIVFLVAKNFEIQNIEKEVDRNRSIVYFEDSPELHKAILAYTNKTNDTNISLVDYMAAEKRVTTLLNLQKTS